MSGIPCTSVARTLLDLAAVGDRGLEQALNEAERRSLLDSGGVEDLLDRSRGRRGVRRLREALVTFLVDSTWTRTELERRFLKLCVQRGLPRPAVNAWIALPGGGVEADFSWTEARLIVEVDGREAHGTRSAFESDRRRDQQLVAAGWRVVRFTWAQVVHEPEAVLATLRRLLAEWKG